MKQARDLENRAAHPDTNSQDYAPSLPMGKWVSFIIDLLLNVHMAA